MKIIKCQKKRLALLINNHFKQNLLYYYLINNAIIALVLFGGREFIKFNVKINYFKMIGLNLAFINLKWLKINNLI
jgi:hypothetical protein